MPMNNRIKKLTRKQAEILAYLKTYIVKNTYPPSIREIGDEFGINSTNGVFDHLNALTRKGYIQREYFQARSITILRNEDGSPFLTPLQAETSKLLGALGDYNFPKPIERQIGVLRKMTSA